MQKQKVSPIFSTVHNYYYNSSNETSFPKKVHILKLYGLPRDSYQILSFGYQHKNLIKTTVIGDNFDKYPTFSDSYFYKLFWKQNLRFTKLNDFYVSKNGGLFQNGNVYLSEDYAQIFFPSDKKNLTYKIIFCSQLLSIGHRWVNIYGHLLINLIPTILSVPNYIVLTSYLPIPFFFQSSFNPLFESINYPIENFISHFDDEILFSKIVYSYANDATLPKPLMYLKFSTLLSKYFETNNINPIQYVILNRDKIEESRSLNNLNEIFFALRSKIPSIKFIKKPTNYSSFKEQVHFYAKTKLLWGVHTSLLFNCVYMKPESVVCEVQFEFIINGYLSSYWSNVLFLAKSLRLKVVFARDPNILWESRNSSISIDLVVRMIQSGLKYLSEKK